MAHELFSIIQSDVEMSCVEWQELCMLRNMFSGGTNVSAERLCFNKSLLIACWLYRWGISYVLWWWCCFGSVDFVNKSRWVMLFWKCWFRQQISLIISHENLTLPDKSLADKSRGYFSLISLLTNLSHQRSCFGLFPHTHFQSKRLFQCF